MSNTAYKTRLNELLLKAGLIATGIVEIRSTIISKTVKVASDIDGAEVLDWETKEISLDEDIQRGSTTCVADRSGRILGYWANDLSSEEADFLHKEAGLPYYHLGEREWNGEKYEGPKDTTFNVFHGKQYDMTVPANVAEVKALLHGSYVCKDRKTALSIDAPFYIYSREEEKKAKQERLSIRKKVAKLVDELDPKTKQEVVRVMHYMGSISIDPYMNTGDAALMFDEYAYEKPISLNKAYEMPKRFEFIVLKTLIATGVVEVGSDTGPYYKSPEYFGTREMFAETEARALSLILKQPDLMKAYQNTLDQNKMEDDAYDKAVTDTVNDILSGHLITDEEQEDDEFAVKINRSNRATLLKMLDESGITHELTNDDDIDVIRNFCIKNFR